MLIVAEDIHKIYQDGRRRLEVLKGIDLSIEESDIVVVVGPSGAGKSTLLHILGGLDKPSQGRVLFDGQDLYAATDKRRSFIRNSRIGFVFQFYHLLPEFNAAENVMMPCLLDSSSRQDLKTLRQKAQGLLRAAGLQDRLQHMPTELSGGEAQRVAIARALVNNPDIVLCDEPTGNLDSHNSELIMNIIRQLNRQYKRSFLIVTHDERLTRFADRILHIEDGIMVY